MKNMHQAIYELLKDKKEDIFWMQPAAKESLGSARKGRASGLLYG